MLLIGTLGHKSTLYDVY